MEHERLNAETPTVETLVNAFERGALSRRDFLRRAGVLGLTAAGAGALADAAAPARARAQTTQKRELVVAQGGDISKFDPHFSTSSNDIRVSFNIFDNLTSRHPDGKLYPEPRHRVEARQDQTTWTLQAPPGREVPQRRSVHLGRRQVQPRADLRPGRQDHGGDGLHHHRPDRGAGPVHARDPHQEAGPAPARPGSPSTAGRSCRRSTWSASAPTRSTPSRSAPARSRFASWVKDDKAVFDANPDYWGGKIDFDRVIMRPIPETAPRVAALLKGEVDVDHAASARPGGAGQRQRHDARSPARSTPGSTSSAVNSKRPPLDNPLVKQALSLAIDREAIVKELWRGRGDRAERADRQGRQPLRLVAAAARLQPEGGARAAEEGRLQGRGDHHRDDGRPTSPRTRRCPRRSRPCGRTSASTSRSRSIEYSVRAQKNREKTFKGLWWSDPTSTLARPRRDDVAAPRPRRPAGLLARRRSSTSWATPRASRVDEKFRAEAYRKMTKIFLEQASAGSPSSSPTRTTGCRSTWSSRRTRTSSSRSGAST